MMVDTDDLRVVFFALIMSIHEGRFRDPSGMLTDALLEAALPLSLPERSDAPLNESWAALVRAARVYARLADEYPVLRSNTNSGELTWQ